MNRTLLLILLFLLFFIWLFYGVKRLSNSICGTSESKTTSVAPVTSGETNTYCGPWSISDLDFDKSSDRYIRFERNEYEALPYSDDILTLLNETSEYLIENQERSLNIVGVYDEDESNSSIYEDLGVARADAIKTLLEEFGVAASQISTGSALVEDGGFVEDTLCHGVEFYFDESYSDNDRINSIGERLSAEPIRLYFETDAKEPNLDSQIRKDLADIIFYLDNVPDSKIEVSGHTDNIGKGNERLSRKRAEYTAEYLSNRGGINIERMDTEGYADAQPISDNNSEEGRALNRRVEVRLRN